VTIRIDGHQGVVRARETERIGGRIKLKWFKHDSNANTDAKLRKLRLKYGMEGYGLYWYCLELIAQNVEKHNLTFELEHDAEILAHDTGIHFERIQEMMQDMVKLGLFENNTGAITCMKMAMRLDETTSKHPKIKLLQDTIRNNSRQSPDSLPIDSGQSPARTEQNRTEQIRTEVQDASRPVLTKKFSKPTFQEVASYCKERGNTVSPNRFMNFYDSNGWKVGKNPMKNWKAAIHTWEEREGGNHATRQPVDNSAIGQVRAANERARQRENTNRQPDAPNLGANDNDVRPPLEV
jgi:Domain of unknown function (DUF4373)